MGLRIEKHLGIEHVLGMRLGQVGGREIVEVLLGQQNAHALVVDPEEGRQIVEIVGGPHLLDRPARQLDAVATGEIELQLRLERPLHVHMQLSLRHAFYEARHGGHDFKPPVVVGSASTPVCQAPSKALVLGVTLRCRVVGTRPQTHPEHAHAASIGERGVIRGGGRSRRVRRCRTRSAPRALRPRSGAGRSSSARR